MQWDYFTSTRPLMGPGINIVPFIPPNDASKGSTRSKLPDDGVAILKEFAEIYRREPTTQEVHDLVARIQREVSFEYSCRSVKGWFYRRRTGQGFEVSPDLPSASLAMTSNGGSRRLLTQEGVDILRGFALEYGRYPSSDEVKNLVEHIRGKTGHRTQAATVKRWFTDHRSQYNLQTLIDARKVSLLTGGLPHNGGQNLAKPTPLTIRVPPRRSVSASLPAASLHNAATHPNTTVDSLAPSLSNIHLEDLKSLQALKDDGVRDVVVSVCATAWGVEKGMIEGWLQENRLEAIYAPPTPISPRQGSPDLSSNEQQYYCPVSAETEIGCAEATDTTSTMLIGQFAHRWPPGVTMQTNEEDSGASLSAPANVPSSDMAENVLDSFAMARALVEAIQESQAIPPCGKKTIGATEFKALWTPSERLGAALATICPSPSR